MITLHQTNLTDRQMDRFLADNPPIGRLKDKDQKFLFGSISKVGDNYFAIFMGDIGLVHKGTKILLWDGTELEVSAGGQGEVWINTDYNGR